MATNLSQTDKFSKEAVQQAAIEYCHAKNLSQRELATKCGIKSDATINFIVNGKWELVSEANLRKVWNVVSEDQEILIDTADNQDVRRCCDTARRKKLMVGLIGDTGMGKTTSLKLVSRKRNTFYVVFDKTMKAKQFFASILKEMGISFEGNIYEMVQRISEELNTIASPLLIIDEAGKLTHNVMLYLHTLRDMTGKNAGIVLAGMPYFKTNLEKHSRRQKEGCSEFLRRINTWHELSGLTKQEITFYCNQNGIIDNDIVKTYFSFRRFGDLSNQILLHHIENE